MIRYVLSDVVDVVLYFSVKFWRGPDVIGAVGVV